MSEFYPFEILLRYYCSLLLQTLKYSTFSVHFFLVFIFLTSVKQWHMFQWRNENAVCQNCMLYRVNPIIVCDYYLHFERCVGEFGGLVIFFWGRSPASLHSQCEKAQLLSYWRSALPPSLIHADLASLVPEWLVQRYRLESRLHLSTTGKKRKYIQVIKMTGQSTTASHAPPIPRPPLARDWALQCDHIQSA